MNAPKVASICSVALILLSLLNFVFKYYTYLVLVVSAHKAPEEQETESVPHPHDLFVPFLAFIPTVSPVVLRPWVLVTAAFIDESVLLLAPSVLLLFYLGKYLELKWGLPDFLKFVAIVAVGSNVTVYLHYTLKALLLGPAAAHPPVVVSSIAVVMALLVAVKQRISNHYMIFFKGNLRIKVTYFPFLLTLLMALAWLISDDFRVSFALSSVGFTISWLYLRYFKASSNERQSYLLPFSQRRAASSRPQGSGQITFDNSQSRGDRSELFSLYTFFPSPLSYVVKLLGNYAFLFMVRQKWVEPKDYTADDDEENTPREEVSTVQSKLFSLSPLKGAAGNVSAIPNADVKLKGLWSWLSLPRTASLGIKSSMDKRRKLAIKELE